MSNKPWNQEELDYLESKWGEISIPGIAKKLNRSIDAVKCMAFRTGLTRHIHSGEYITLNQLMKALGRGSVHTYTLISWVENRGLPIKLKRSVNKKFRVIFLSDFWKWAKVNRKFINFAKFDENMLGEEPNWVKEQRKADIMFAAYKNTPWTKEEDDLLRFLLNSYSNSYRDISVRLKRTEGALKRRMITLKIKQRPLKADNHTPWTFEETKTLTELLDKGYKAEVIAEYIDRSASAIKGKIERMQKTA